MPDPALIGAAAQGIGGILDAQAQQQTNRDSQMFSREMYEKQKQDAIAFWNLQNSYNSPEQQMARLRAAGLNPNMVYGQSSGGASGQAASINTPDVQAAQFRSPEWGRAVGGAGLTYMNAIYDLDIKQAQAKNLEAQNDVIKQDFALKVAQTKSTMTAEERARFDLDLASELRPISAESAKEQLRQTKTNIDLSLNRDVREAMQNSSSLSEAAERIKTMAQQRSQSSAETRRIIESINQLEKDGTLKDLEIQLKRQGISWSDPLYFRTGSKFLQSILDEESPLSKSIKDATRNPGQKIWDYFKYPFPR